MNRRGVEGSEGKSDHKKSDGKLNKALEPLFEEDFDRDFDKVLDKNFDEIFDEAFDSAARDQTFVPDSDQSWLRVQQALAKKAKRSARLRLLPYVAASFLLGAFIFGTPAATNAFSPFIKSVAVYTDNMVNIIFGTGNRETAKPITAPPPGHGESSTGTDSSGYVEPVHTALPNWNNILPNVAFYAPSLDYIPDGFELQSIETLSVDSNQKITNVVLLYQNLHASDQKYSVTLKQMKENETLESSSTLDSTSLNTMNIGGKEIHWLKGKSDWSTLEFVINNTYIGILGNISDEQLLLIAEQIQ